MCYNYDPAKIQTIYGISSAMVTIAFATICIRN